MIRAGSQAGKRTINRNAEHENAHCSKLSCLPSFGIQFMTPSNEEELGLSSLSPTAKSKT